MFLSPLNLEVVEFYMGTAPISVKKYKFLRLGVGLYYPRTGITARLATQSRVGARGCVRNTGHFGQSSLIVGQRVDVDVGPRYYVYYDATTRHHFSIIPTR